jgi:hypothetical protein
MSNKATQQERDFAIVMQQLSNEAEKILPGDQSNSLPEVRDPTEPGQQPDAFFERLHGLENSVLNRLNKSPLKWKLPEPLPSPNNSAGSTNNW